MPDQLLQMDMAGLIKLSSVIGREMVIRAGLMKFFLMKSWGTVEVPELSN